MANGEISRRRARRPNIEILEARIALSITIAFDYSRDTSGLFSANPVTQALLQQAGQSLGSQINNHLAAIAPDPGAGNTWTMSPQFAGDFVNPSLPSDTILVEVVGAPMGPSGFAAEAGPSGFNVSGSSDWVNLVETRGGNSRNSALLGGGIDFNTNESWFTNGEFDQSFFYGVALHELGHVLGLGTTQAWTNFVNSTNNTFNGPHAEAEYGGPVPLDASSTDSDRDAHWAESDLSGGQAPVMVPVYRGTQAFTSLDWAGLADVGWSVGTTGPGGGNLGERSSPTIVGAQVLTAGKGKHKHVSGFELIFSEALAPLPAANGGNYSMTQTIKLGRKTVNQAVKFSARYAGGSNRVDLLFAGKPTFARGGRISVLAAPPGGVTDIFGNPLAVSTTLYVLPGARGLSG